MYQERGFTVAGIHANKEFQCIKEAIHPVPMDVITTNSHIPEVERSIRMIKEHCRTTIHGMPFHRLLRVMIRQLVWHVGLCLNQLPRLQHGLLEHMSPTAIIKGD